MNTPRTAAAIAVILGLILALPAAAAVKRAEPIIIDHTCRTLGDIPQKWIVASKDQLRICYGHTSHGRQPAQGMQVLMDDPSHGGLYDFNYDGDVEPDVLSIDDMVPDGDLGSPDRTTWATRTRDHLNGAGSDRNVVIWSWCGQVSTAEEADIDLYLGLMNTLEQDFPNVTFVYMTGHLDGTGETGNLNIRNNQIRAFCIANDKVLFDFADIESYDPDGNYYVDRGGNDNCGYNGGNWADEWCDAHSGSPLCYNCDCSHSKPLNCNLKGRAFWWLCARITGWLSTPDEYYIAHQPSSMTFSALAGGSSPDDQTLEIWRAGTGTLDWNVADDASWLSLNPASGSSTGEHDPVTVSVDITGLTPDIYNAVITISDPGALNSPQTVAVSLTVTAPDEYTIAFEPANLSFTALQGGPPPSDQTLEIWREGTGTLSWTVTETSGWLTLTPTSGSSTGEHDPVTVQVDTTGLPAGPYDTVITISDPGAMNSPRTVPVNLTVVAPDEYAIAFEPESLSFTALQDGPPPSGQILEIWREGAGTLSWTVTENSGWLTLSPTSGSSSGERDPVTVEVDASGLSAGPYNTVITISDPGAVNSPRTVPVSLTVTSAESFIVAGPGPAYHNPPEVRVFASGQDGTPLYTFDAYGASHFGVNVSCGKMTGGETHAILTGAGPGNIYGPHVRGFTPEGTPISGLSFLAYGTNKFGVNVAAGDLDGDGYDELITGAGPGPVFGPHVRAFNFDGAPPVSPLSGVSYFAYGTNKFGVNVAAGDLDGDGYDEIVTGAGPGAVFGPHVRGWNVDNGTASAISAVSFMAYGTFRYGVRVTAGDLDGDGLDEIVTAPGPSPAFGAHIRGWNCDGTSASPMPGVSFFAWPPNQSTYGARVSADADLDGDGRDELVVGAGPDPSAATSVNVYRYVGSDVDLWFSVQAFPPDITSGTSVAGGRFAD